LGEEGPKGTEFPEVPEKPEVLEGLKIQAIIHYKHLRNNVLYQISQKKLE
jgi:hypothetical protein